MGDSFHRADWIGVAQALGGMLAVVAAFAVSSLQARHSERLRRIDSLEKLDGLAKLVEATHAQVEIVLDDVSKKKNFNGLFVLTAEKLQAVGVVFDALASVPIEIAPSAASVQGLLDAKTALVHAKVFVPDLTVDPSARFYLDHVEPLRKTGDRLKAAADALRREHKRLSEAG